MPEKVKKNNKPNNTSTKKEEEVDMNAIVKSLIVERIKEEITHPNPKARTQYVKDDPHRTYTRADPVMAEEE